MYVCMYGMAWHGIVWWYGMVVWYGSKVVW